MRPLETRGCQGHLFGILKFGALWDTAKVSAGSGERLFAVGTLGLFRTTVAVVGCYHR